MTYENLGRLFDHWINYPPFRQAMRKNPVEAVRQSGVQLSPQELEVIRNIDWSLTDDALQERISKLFA